MKIKPLLCIAMVLKATFILRNCDSAIVYPNEPEGGRQMVMQFAIDCEGLSPTNELTIAPPFREYDSGNLAKGQLLAGATSSRDGWRMWRYIFMQGTNAVGEAELEAIERTGRPLKCNSLGDSQFPKESDEVALQAAARWPQVQKQDYEPRLLDCPLVSFRAMWLHGQSNDIIIPLPPTYNRMNAYQPYSESQIITILAPDAKRKVAMRAKLFAQERNTLHLGDTAPLRAALSNLLDNVAELSTATLSPQVSSSDDVPPSEEDNTVTANYTVSGDNDCRLMMTARAYDSEAAARAGLTRDQRMKQVWWSKTQLVQGVTIYEYTPYGSMDFQVGRYTFELQSNKVDSRQSEFTGRLQAMLAMVQGRTNASSPSAASSRTTSAATKPEDPLALLLKASSALIANLAPPAK